jgi:hypothetical protein
MAERIRALESTLMDISQHDVTVDPRWVVTELEKILRERP